jgi:hypothetical protein
MRRERFWSKPLNYGTDNWERIAINHFSPAAGEWAGGQAQ